MGGFIKAALDPVGIFDGLADNGGPTGPDNTPSVWNGPKGFLGGMMHDMGGKTQQINQYLNDQKPVLDTSAYTAAPPPRVAPFQAQWSYTAGKGPQWLEPVDNGTTQKTVRSGDIIHGETVDNGWSSQVNNGPAKGNRF